MEGSHDLYLNLSRIDGQNLPIPVAVGGYTDENCCIGKPFHRHNFYEISWIAHDNATLVCDFVTYELPSGTAAFVTPGQVHRWTHSVPHNIIVFSFKPELLLQGGMDVRQALSGLPFHNPTIQPGITSTSRQTVLHLLFTEALNIFQTQSATANDLLASYLRLILAEIKAQGATDNNSALSTSQNLLRQFYQALQQHGSARLKVQDYASLLGVTSSHLVETIRQTAGVTPGHILQDHLLLESKRLLVYSPDTIAEIAYKLSFQTTSHFGQWFRKNEGQTPGEFRRQYQLPYN